MKSPKDKSETKYEEEKFSEIFEETTGENQSKSAPENKNRLPENAENAVPPKAWKNQKKAYEDAWENNKNQQLDNDF